MLSSEVSSRCVSDLVLLLVESKLSASSMVLCSTALPHTAVGPAGFRTIWLRMTL